MKSILIRLARKILETVLAGLAQQLNVVQEQANKPIQQMIQKVVGGMWIGEGANAFVEEVSSLLVPDVGRVENSISTMSKNLNTARDIVERADAEVNRLISSRLAGPFKFF